MTGVYKSLDLTPRALRQFVVKFEFGLGAANADHFLMQEAIVIRRGRCGYSVTKTNQSITKNFAKK